MSRTMAVHVRYKSVCISLPSPAKQQHKMTKFFVVWGTRRTMAKISHFQLRLNAVVTCLILNKGVLNRSRHDNCEIHRWNINSIVIRRCPWICNSDKIWFRSRKTQIFSYLRFSILKESLWDRQEHCWWNIWGLPRGIEVVAAIQSSESMLRI